VATALAAEGLLSLALSVTSEQCVESVLKKTVEGLALQPGIALARVWLLPSVHIPASWQEFSDVPDGAECLRLVASAGKPNNSPGEDWSFLQGKFARFPLGAGKVGQVAAERKPLLVRNFAPHETWVARPDWAQREGIRSFAGYPLIFRDNLLGVIGVFSRRPLDDQQFTWLGVFANHASVAIANARAFEEVEKLQRQLQGENEYLQEQVRQSFEFGEILGRSKALSDVLHNVHLVATTDSTVLIGGESGTGKELVARAIHEGSARHERPLITVNCASVPRELFESEFFGHVKGAFTGALRDRLGRFQLADKGTLFLDEVAEIPFELQSKLLRVLQEGTFERVGEDRVRRVDVRVIAATNRDLFHELEAGRFRRDLYFRLNVFPLRMPPLRDRPEDIGLLAEHFALLASQRLKIPYSALTATDIELLSKYAWPGNVRELQNVIERAVIISQGGPLRIDIALGSFENNLNPACIRASVLSKQEMQRRETENILKALGQSKGKIYGPDGAAAILGIKPTTLASRMKKLKVAAAKRTSA
jgi:transcriptional regulator with GAF, ATPase, and Fis domain